MSFWKRFWPYLVGGPSVLIAYNLALNLTPDPPAVIEGRTRAALYRRGKISEEEFRDPALHRKRQAEREGLLDQQRAAAWVQESERRKREIDERERTQQWQREVEGGELEEAGKSAKKALRLLDGTVEEGAAVMLAAEVCVEQGEFEDAKTLFLKAVELDPEGDLPERVGGGAEKFLWLAQLDDEGGKGSVQWFEKGAEILREQLASMAEDEGDDKKKKLAGALCGIVEVYMTDLSWEEDAEDVCERNVAEAFMIAPDEPETLQTLANVRISQGRIEEAKNALSDSLTLWSDLPPEDPSVPAFPARVSLVRLLLEVEMENEASHVLQRLVDEDDQSVEAWYLGGWCQHLLASKGGKGDSDQEHVERLSSARDWLNQSLTLYDLLDYEDDRLHQHAAELVASINEEIGQEKEEEEQDDGPEESGEDDSDVEMGEAEGPT